MILTFDKWHHGPELERELREGVPSLANAHGWLSRREPYTVIINVPEADEAAVTAIVNAHNPAQYGSIHPDAAAARKTRAATYARKIEGTELEAYLNERFGV